jgi:hypothetical protein
MSQKRSKTTKKKKKTSKSIKKNHIGTAKTAQSKYHVLNMKVQANLDALGLNSKGLNFIENPDEIKMSAVILKLADPYLKMYWGNEIRVRQIISLAITIWNMSFLPQEQQIKIQEQWIDEALPQEGEAKEASTIIQIFETFQERRRKFFPNIRKYIIGYDLNLYNQNIQLNVSSKPLIKEKQANDKMPGIDLQIINCTRL